MPGKTPSITYKARKNEGEATQSEGRSTIGKQSEALDPNLSYQSKNIDLAPYGEQEGASGGYEEVSIPDNLPAFGFEEWYECADTTPSEFSPVLSEGSAPGGKREEDRWNFIMNKLINIENNTCCLTRDVNSLTAKVDGQADLLKEVKSATVTNEHKIKELHKRQDSMMAEMDQRLEDRFKRMESAMQRENEAFQAAVMEKSEAQVRESTQEAKDVFLQGQCEFRKLNLLLIGMKEGEGEDLEKVVSSFFSKRMALSDIEFETAYRLGKPGGSNPRPILIHFPRIAPRQRVWFSKSKITTDKGESKVWIQEDLPKAVKQVQRTFFRIIKKAKSFEGRFEGTHIRGQSLIVDGKAYGENNLETLPDVLRPSNLATLQSEKAVAFFGRFSPLSNHHPSPFQLDGLRFSCMEQFLAWSRATLAGDGSLVTKALAEADPVVYKGILTDLRNNKPEEWSKQLDSIALKGLRAKFHQNPPLAHFLCSTHPKIIGEASLNKRWGTGFTLTHPSVLQSEEWPAKGNLLGKSLMIIREELVVSKNA